VCSPAAGVRLYGPVPPWCHRSSLLLSSRIPRPFPARWRPRGSPLLAFRLLFLVFPSPEEGFFFLKPPPSPSQDGSASSSRVCRMRPLSFGSASPFLPSIRGLVFSFLPTVPFSHRKQNFVPPLLFFSLQEGDFWFEVSKDGPFLSSENKRVPS